MRRIIQLLSNVIALLRLVLWLLRNRRGGRVRRARQDIRQVIQILRRVRRRLRARGGL